MNRCYQPLLALVLSWATLAPLHAEAGEAVSFDQIRSILSENCFHCHGPDAAERKADLRLDTHAGATRDLGGYAAIVPGDPNTSELIVRIFTTDKGDLMPPPDSNRSLTEQQRALIQRWVEQGGNYEQHWAFVPPTRPEPPQTTAKDWPRNAIDQFVLARLSAEGLSPSPEADAATLVRRLYLDLTGLPPTPQQIQAYLNDQSKPEAYVKLVDQLLDSPHYGEQMALPWLDAARYADSNGFQQDGDRHMWVWRDWVVQALNNNMPFDQFTIEQLAGDLLPEPTQSQLIATGFNRNHMLNGEGGAIAEEQRNNYVFDRVDTTATNWLGLTLACAQCHDHKYDPLSQVDYYRFFAYFNNLPESGKVDKRLGRIQFAEPSLNIASEAQQEEESQINKAIRDQKKILDTDKDAINTATGVWWDAGVDTAKLPDKLKPVADRKYASLDGYNTRFVREEFLKQTDNQIWSAAQKKITQLESKLEKLRRATPVVMIMKEQEEVRPTHVLDRGDYLSPKQLVTPGTPESLLHLPDAPANRLGLAQWLVHPENPLMARVIVNRYWQQFFGTGLVKTSEDFGVQGERPSHPELLDWLAVEFRESGWDVKHLHRLILTSATYRQSSKMRPELRDRDPENRILARASRYRLPSLTLRDQALALSGLLVKDMGGQPVYPYQPAGLWLEFSYEKFSYTPDSGEKLYRRSLYTFWRRTLGPPNIFDAANRQTCAVNPTRTNTPLHALTTLNDPTYVEAARVWAERMILEGSAEPTVWAFHQATGRMPTPPERNTLKRSLEKALTHYQAHPEEASELLTVGEWKADPKLDPVEVASYAMVGQLILNLDEVLNRE